MYNYLVDFAQTFGAHRVALPAWLGRVLHKAQAVKLAKGASHKYIRKIPTGKTSKMGKPTFRYYYTVGGGAGLGHHSEFVEGAAFRVKDAGKEGHFHIVKTPTDGSQSVTIRHDESGKTSTITRAALRELLHNEHAEPLRQAKQRAAATLEQAKKTGTPKQQERARQQAEKVGAKEKGGVGAFEFDKARAADFAGLWSRTLEPSAIRTQAANNYNKHLQNLAQSLHDLAPTDPRAAEAFEEHKEVFDAAFQRWADKAGALAGEGYKRGGVEASAYDTAHMRDQAHKATTELLTVKDDARKIINKIKALPKKDDPTLFLQSKIKVTQAKLDKLQRLNEILNTSPKGWTPTKMQFIDNLDLDKSDLRDYGRTGVPTKTINYLKQTIRDLDKKIYLMEEDEKRGVRESKRADEQQGSAPTPTAATPKTEAEALAHVNDLPLPEIETRGGKGDWRERRHHMGDVSISATGPYATLNDAAKRSLARMWRARRLEDLGHASSPLWAQIKNDDAKNQPPSVTKSLARLFGI